jgi:hypothetical protein
MENVLFETIKDLSAAGIDYVICGGIACILHGSDRNSLDLDININLKPKNIQKLIKLAKNKNWQPRIPVSIDELLDSKKREYWINQKNAKVFTLNTNDGLLQIDIFLVYPIDFPELKNQANTFEIDGITFYVSSIDHLIVSKQAVNPKRNQDIYDIAILTKIKNHE